MAKIEEEVAELRETLEKEPDNAARAEEEMGDLFFAIANLSRRLGIEPEAALRKANEKFTKRFNQMEANFHANGRTLDGATLEEMDAEWERIKKHEHINRHDDDVRYEHEGTKNHEGSKHETTQVASTE